MPLYLQLDPKDPSTSFTYTPDSEIVTMYENGLSMSCIVRALMWQDGIEKRTIAQLRVNRALLNYHLGGVRVLPSEVSALPFGQY